MPNQSDYIFLNDRLLLLKNHSLELYKENRTKEFEKFANVISQIVERTLCHEDIAKIKENFDEIYGIIISFKNSLADELDNLNSMLENTKNPFKQLRLASQIKQAQKANQELMFEKQVCQEIDKFLSHFEEPAK